MWPLQTALERTLETDFQSFAIEMISFYNNKTHMMLSEKTHNKKKKEKYYSYRE